MFPVAVLVLGGIAAAAAAASRRTSTAYVPAVSGQVTGLYKGGSVVLDRTGFWTLLQVQAA